MIDGNVSREPVQSPSLNEGYTKIILERTVGLGLADGGIGGISRPISYRFTCVNRFALYPRLRGFSHKKMTLSTA
jgi:hypothetical protein